MAEVMLARQKLASVTRWNAAFRGPGVDAVRRRHGPVVTSPGEVR